MQCEHSVEPPAGHEPGQPERAPAQRESAGADAAPPPELAGYRVVAALGRGGSGSVYEARALADDEPVALKVTHLAAAESLASLQREADALRTIGPPHVPELLAAGALPDGRAYLVMRRPPHPTLAELLARAGRPLELDAFRRAADAILAALEAVHARGVVHRDVKPENLLLDLARPHAWLIDFGLAASLGDPARAGGAAAPARPEATIVDSFRGTAEYAAPEQCGAHHPIDRRTDLYAAGAILYEMLTGRPPFVGSAAEVKQAHLALRPARPGALAAVPGALEQVVLRCLAKHPGERFASAGELRAALAGAIDFRARPRASTQRPPAAAVKHERHSVGLVFFESEADPGHVRSMLEGLGGRLGDARRQAYVAVFGHDSDENPVGQAIRAALHLVSASVAARALVDMDLVAVQRRLDGTRRHVSAAFSRRERFPAPADPRGVLLTTVAAALVTELGLDVAPVRAGVVHVEHLPQVKHVTHLEAPVELLVGRDAELQRLVDSALAALADRRPAIATVLGEAGHGKSRLLRALVEQLHQRAALAQLVTLSPREPLTGEVDQTLCAVLRRFLRLPDERPDDAGRRLVGECLGPAAGAQLWAPVALALGWLSHEAPEIRALAVAPGTLRSAAARAAALGMLQAARARPLLFVLDNAGVVGQGMLEALEFATLADAAVPLWICVAARPSHERSLPGWSARGDGRCVVRLGPLDPDSAGELCRRLLEPAQHIPAAIIERIVSLTQGIPLHIIELIRALAARGGVRRHAKGDAWYVAADELDIEADLPLVEWLTRRELDAMPANLVAHARLAALLGGEFTVRDLAGVLQELDREGVADEFPLDAAVGVERLVAQGLLCVQRGRVSFVHALVRAAVERSLPEAVRTPVHRAAYRFYGGHGGLLEHERLARLAYHAARAGLAAEALAYHLQLAERARARHDYLEAEALYGAALAHTTDEQTGEQVVALRGRGLMRYRLSRYEDALADFDRARGLAEASGDALTVCEILLDAATALDWTDEYRRSRELVDQAAALAAGGSSPPLEARVLMGLARSAFRFDRCAEAVELFERAAAGAERLGDAGYETLVISRLLSGYILAQLGRLDESERMFELVIPLCEARGDQLHLGAALGNRAMLWICRNDEHRLLADLRRLLEIARELGNGRMEQQAHFYLGLFLHWMGDSGAAERHARCAVAIDDRRHGEAARPESALLLARIVAGIGDAAGARAILEDIRGRQQRARERGDRELALLPAEQVVFSMIDLSVRDAPEAEWEALAERAREQLGGPDLIELFLVRGASAARRGAPEHARRALAEAHRLATAVPNLLRARIERLLTSSPSA